MKGIDISNYQANLDLSTIEAEICIIKATEGLTYTSPSFKIQYALAKLNNMKVGFYHFLRNNDPVAEAKHFLHEIEGLKSDCKYIIDAENQAEAVGVSARIRKFADYLISQGKEPCLYTYRNFYNTELTSIVKDLPLWVADYSNIRPNLKSVGWQYCGTGLDLNVFEEGILLNKKEVKLMSKITSKSDPVIYQLQNACIALNMNDSHGNRLDLDGLDGPSTQEAKHKLKVFLNYVLK